MKPAAAVQELARSFEALAQTKVTEESKAAAVIVIVKSNQVRTLKGFKELVHAAYALNGWNTTPGKPRKGSALKSVPNTVKQCVSHVVAAYRLKLGVAEFTTYHQLRKAVKEMRAKVNPPSKDPEMLHVDVRHTNKATGAAFHELLSLYSNADAKDKPVIARAVKEFTERMRNSLDKDKNKHIPEPVYRRGAR